MKKVKLKLTEFKNFVMYVRRLKAKLKECERINKFYKDQITAYNAKFSREVYEDG